MLAKALRYVRAALTTSVTAALLIGATGASAAQVKFFSAGRTSTINNRFLSGVASAATPPPGLPAVVTDPLNPAVSPVASVARAIRALRHAQNSGPAATFPSALLALLRSGQIPGATYRNDLRIWRGALSEERQIAAWRSAQLGDVTALLHELAARGQVTAARLPALIVILQRNAQYWRSGARLAYPDRVQFAGSELVWEYYPGYGLQFQVLGTFGEGDGYFEAGPTDYPKLVELISEVNRLAVKRAGGIAWEYYFNWEGGNPPWVSAMAQATGIEALTDAYLATGNHAYLTEAHSALPLFERSPPSGTAVAASLGTRYLQYSFAPGTDIINAYLQALLGLYDYEHASLDPTALTLFNAGNAQAEQELPSFIIGGWSLYQPGVPDNLNYHELVTGFLQLLCQKTAVPVYCSTYKTFSADLTTKPVLAQMTVAALAGKKFNLTFALSKYAAVGVQLSSATRNFLYTKQTFYAGTDSFRAPALKPGLYTLAMSATDPAGNYTHTTGQLEVCATACPPYSIAPPTVTTTTPTKTSTTPTTTATTPTATTTTPTGTSTTTTPVTTSTTVTATTPTTTTVGGGGTSGL